MYVGTAAAVVWLALLGALAWRQTLFWKDSTTLYERVVAVEPGNYFGWHNLAVQYQLAGRHEHAIAAERRSIENHPGKGNLPARVNLAHLLRLLGRGPEALDTWRAIIAVDPGHAEALAALVNERLQARDNAGAVALLEEALARAPESIEAYAELARVHALAGRPTEVLAAWERAARALPASPRALHGVGAALLALGRDPEAGEWLERAFQMDNHDVEIAVDFARALARAGHTSEASGLLQQVLAASPGHPRALAAQRAMESGERP
jgi:tetratricopeptide (TPR) repeat protein